MKICMICPEIGNAGRTFIGGHVNNVVRLSKALADRAHKITIVTTPHRYPTGKSEDLEFAEIQCLPVNEPYLSAVYNSKFATRAILKVRELSRCKSFDVIHGHSGYAIPALITGISGKISGIPSVHSVYCPIENNKSDHLLTLFSNKALGKFYFHVINKVVAVTENVARSLISAGISEEKIVVLPPLIDTNKFNSEVTGDDIRNEFGIESDQPILLYIGNLSRIKGLHILIDALNMVKKKYSQIRLFMVLNMPLDKYENLDRVEVDAELLTYIKQKIKTYELEENIVPIGLTENMPRIMAASDIFIMPFLGISGIADYPLSLLEILSIGKPVIATKVGGVQEIIRHHENGLLINPGNSFELADAILYMLKNKDEFKKAMAEGTKLVSEKFGTETVVNKLERIYEEVICGN